MDVMGDDAAIVQAARISYGKGTKTLSSDRALIRYLMRHRHTSPFEMCELKLHVKVPMDAWRQWTRHRTASINEYSTRYSEAIDERQVTLPGEWRSQSKNNRQGSGCYLDPAVGEVLSKREQSFHAYTQNVYQQRLSWGVSREQARKDLPLSTYTEAYWKIDLHNLFGFLALRMSENAQFEIREFARVIGGRIVSKWVPLAWEAFFDYRLDSISLSGAEVRCLQRMLHKVCKKVDDEWILSEKQTGELSIRELREFQEKLQKLLGES